MFALMDERSGKVSVPGHAPLKRNLASHQFPKFSIDSVPGANVMSVSSLYNNIHEHSIFNVSI